MEKIKYYYELYKKQILFTISFSVIIIIACLSFFIINHKYNSDEIVEEENDIAAYIEEKNSNNEETQEKIKVDIKGCVKNPGVYEMSENKRVIDAIELAGGITSNAHTKSLNLSQKLFDEDVIIIYSKEEVKAAEAKNETLKNTISKTTTSGVITKKTQTSTNTNNSSNNTSTTSKNDTTLNAVVNINTATIEELMTLKGIGKSKAEKIIEYRNTNGGFGSIEDLKNVSGIGEAIYAKIKDNITV